MKIPADKNVLVPEFEKLSEYKDLDIEVQKLSHMNTVTIPVVIGASGMIKRGTGKHLQKIPEKEKPCLCKKMQKKINKKSNNDQLKQC